jgi:hypothetical protein
MDKDISAQAAHHLTRVSSENCTVKDIEAAVDFLRAHGFKQVSLRLLDLADAVRRAPPPHP